MDKLAERKNIDRWLTDNNGYMLFNVTGYDEETGELEFQVVSAEEWAGIDFPKFFDRKKYPTRVSAGILKMITLDEDFTDEVLTAYSRFLKGDWGELEEYPEIIVQNDRYPELATGYYMTSWGEICIKQDRTFTTAYLPFEN